MRTPNQVFKDMCPQHGEIWVLGESGWQCIRKTDKGTRYVDRSKTEPPLCVRELLSFTNSTWAHFDSLLGRPELLVTRAQLAELESQRTQPQLMEEEKRLKEMKRARISLRQEIVRLVRENLEAQLKFSHLIALHEEHPEEDQDLN